MKRCLFLISLILAFCFADANKIDQNTAKEIGKRFLQVSAEMKIADTEDLQLVTIYNTNDDDVAFYIFNSSNGFVIVSAVDYAIPILGYSDEGRFDNGNVPIQMEEYLQGFVEQIQYGKDHNLTPNDETALQWELVRTTGRINNKRSTDAVAPLLTTTWDQNQYYNYMCPADANGPGGHVYAGCVATAMGQIMKYWEYPTTGNGSHTYTPEGYPQQSVNFGATTYDWSNMPNALTYSSTMTQINAVAQLIWHCGVAVDMDYSYTWSGSNITKTYHALTDYFNYSDDLTIARKIYYTNDTWFELIKQDIDAGQPVFYAGTGSSGGHAFVCDGYNSSDQLHFNWGWSGSNNNYFSLGALNPGGYNFNYNNEAIISIHPMYGVTCQISATASPTNGGIITGGGTYPQYQSCTVTATPAPGFEFLYWKENNNIVSISASYTFLVRQNRNLVAVFSLPTVTNVTASYYPDASNPDSQYVEITWGAYSAAPSNETASIPTAVNENRGGNWYYYDNGINDSNLGFQSGGFYWGIMLPAGTYDGSSLTKISYFDFEASTGQIMIYQGGSTAPELLLHSQNYNVTGSNTTVEFALSETVMVDNTQSLWIVMHNDSGQYVASMDSGPGVANGSCISLDGTTWFNTISEATSGSIDGNWNLRAYIETYPPVQYYNVYRTDCANNGPYTSSNTTTIATQQTGSSYIDNTWQSPGFGSYKFGVSYVTTEGNESNIIWSNCLDKGVGYTISATASPSQGGIVNGAGLYEQGTTCTLTATASTGYTFVNWTKNGTAVSTNSTYSFTVTENATYVANFNINTYEVTASADPAEGGSVSGAGTFNHGSTCTLTATANTGYSFVNWTKNGTSVSTNSTYSFAVTESGSYVANFSLNSYIITATVEPAEGGSVTGGGTFNHGASCTLTATTNVGYTFANWTKNGTVVSTDASYTFTVTETAEYVAHFNAITFDITASANPTEGGNVVGAGTYNYGATCTLSATANVGYTFDNWTQDGTIVSSEASFSITVNEDASYVANFSLNSYTITVEADPAEGGTADGGGTFNHGETCTLTATPNGDYNFVNWTKNGTVVSANASYTFTVTEEGNYVAHFSQDVYYTVVASAYPVEGGTVSGSGAFLEGETCTLTATANTGYSFVNWTKNGVVVSTNTTYSFTVNETAEFIANFSMGTYTVTAVTNPADGGTINGSGTFNYGETATLVVIPNENYTFINWTENGNVVSTDITYSFTVTEDHSIVANLQYFDGVDENGANTFIIYPNPVSDKLMIESQEIVNRCDIYTVSGSLVLSEDENSNSFAVEVGDLRAGTYIIRLTTGDKVQTKQFIKK